MEGISIGESRHIGLNFKVFSEDEVVGWCYSLGVGEEYSIVHSLFLMDDEVHLGPKCLIQW